MSERITVKEGAQRFLAGDVAPSVPHPADVFVPGIERLWRALGPLFDMKLPADYNRLLGNALARMCRQASSAGLTADQEYALGLVDALTASRAVESHHGEKLRSLISKVARDLRPTTTLDAVC